MLFRLNLQSTRKAMSSSSSSSSFGCSFNSYDDPDINSHLPNDNASISVLNQINIVDLLEIYPTDSDIVCRYSTNHGFEYSEGDKIGIFEVGWQSLDDVSFTQKAPHPTEAIILKAENLPKDEKVYQLCYITCQDKIAGASIPFFFQTPSENELVAVEDSAHDFMTVKSNFALVQTQNTQLTLQNEKLIRELAEVTKALDCAKVSECLKCKEKAEKLEMKLNDMADGFNAITPPLSSNHERESSRWWCNQMRIKRLCLGCRDKEGFEKWNPPQEDMSVSEPKVNDSFAALKPASEDEQSDQIMPTLSVLSNELSRVESENRFLKEEIVRLRKSLATEKKEREVEQSWFFEEFEQFLRLCVDLEKGVHTNESAIRFYSDRLSRNLFPQRSRALFHALLSRWFKGKEPLESNEGSTTNNSKASGVPLNCVTMTDCQSTFNSTLNKDSVAVNNEQTIAYNSEASGSSGPLNSATMSECQSAFNSFLSKDSVAINSEQTREEVSSNDTNGKKHNESLVIHNGSFDSVEALMSAFQIPHVFLQAAEDTLHNVVRSSFNKCPPSQRKVLCDIPYMKAPINVILGQQVMENTVFELSVQTLSEFRMLTIKFMTDIATIPLQLQASNNPVEGVILNSLNGVWGLEERHKEFTLKANNVYCITISVKQDEFELKIAETHSTTETAVTFSFLHRISPIDVRYVNISGDVVINESFLIEPNKTCCQQINERFRSAFLEYLSLSHSYLAQKKKLDIISKAMNTEDTFDKDAFLKDFVVNQTKTIGKG